MRHHLSRCLRESLTDEEWDLLERFGDVGDLITDIDLVDDVAEKVRAMRKTYRTSPAGSMDSGQSLRPSRSASVGDRSTAVAFAE